jgi:hypothetical protein
VFVLSKVGIGRYHVWHLYNYIKIYHGTPRAILNERFCLIRGLGMKFGHILALADRTETWIIAHVNAPSRLRLERHGGRHPLVKIIVGMRLLTLSVSATYWTVGDLCVCSSTN